MSENIEDVLNKTDWTLLSQQKQALLNAIKIIDESPTRDDAMLEGLEGILAWVDALQDAAFGEGHPVVFLGE